MEWNNDKKSADIMPYTYVWTSDGRLQIQGQVPARLDSIQAANMLGFNPADLVVLKKHKILFPMGQVPHKGRKA